MVTWNENTRVIGPSHGTVSEVKALVKGSARLTDTYNYVDTVFALCHADTMPDAAIVFAQAFQETSENGVPFNSYWWKERLNPAGIGITGTASQNNASRVFKTGAEAARAHVAHLLLYVTGEVNQSGLKPTDDPRYDAYRSAFGAKGVVVNIGDLGDGVWAADPNYAAGILGHLNTSFKDSVVNPSTQPPKETPPMATLNFDPKLAPLPVHNVRYAWNKRENVGTNDLGARVFRGNTVHRAYSNGQSFTGAIDWLLNPEVKGLADFFVDHRTGAVTWINPMRALASTFSFKMDPNWEDGAGWTNGPYNAGVASSDARAFLSAHGSQLGANIINQDLENFEVTGDYGDPVSEAARESIRKVFLNRAQILKIPYDVWPINPATGVTVMFGHREFCGVDFKECPGVVLWTWINGVFIDEIRTRLKAIQTGTPITTTPTVPTTPTAPVKTYVKPIVPAWVKSWDGSPVIEGVEGAKDGRVFASTTQYVAKVTTPRLQLATDSSAEVGTDLAVGEDFPVAFTFTANDGKAYAITWYGTRVRLADLKVVGKNPLTA